MNLILDRQQKSRILKLLFVLITTLFFSSSFAGEANAEWVCGGTIKDRETITSPVDPNGFCDYWFDAKEGDRVTIIADGHDGSRPHLFLVNYKGEVLVEETRAIYGYKLERGGNGPYGLRVQFEHDPGKFNLLVKKVVQTCGGNIQYGQELTHENTPDWPHCDYWFQGSQNDRVLIEVTVLSGNLSPRILFVDKDARILYEMQGNRLRYQLDRGNGYYGFRITSPANSTGTYGSFKVTLRTEAPPPPPPTPTPPPPPPPSKQTDTKTITFYRQAPYQGNIYYIAKTGIPGGVLKEIKNPNLGYGKQWIVQIIKPGYSSADCGVSGKTVVLEPGDSTTEFEGQNISSLGWLGFCIGTRDPFTNPSAPDQWSLRLTYTK